MPTTLTGPLRVLDRYALFDEIAAGGMATVHIGRLMGPVGFSRTVAIKRLHPQYAKDAEFVTMFLDEARLASRIRHPNVVQTIDVVAKEGELFLVMEYVQGESMSRLVALLKASSAWMPLDVLSGIAFGFLNGLHAAHEAKDEQGVPLNLVHRDVSPQNVLVGTDGVARALDFGIAKAVSQVHSTRDGQLKGKLAYMAPEQLDGQTSRATDVYASAVVIWEALAVRRLFQGDSERVVLGKLLRGATEPPSLYHPDVPRELDDVVMRALSVDPSKRYATALEMARAMAKVVPIAPPIDIGEWVERTSGPAIAGRSALLARIEAESSTGSRIASRLAAAAASGTDPRLVLESSPPPPDDAARALALSAEGSEGSSRASPAPALAPPAPPLEGAPRPSSDAISTQLGALTSRPTRLELEPSPARRRGALVLAAIGGAVLVLLVLRLTMSSSPDPAAASASSAQAPTTPTTTAAATSTPPPASTDVAPPTTGVAPEPPPTAHAADPASASSSAAVPRAVTPPRPPPARAPIERRPAAPSPPRGNQPRIDDPLLQAR